MNKEYVRELVERLSCTSAPPVTMAESLADTSHDPCGRVLVVCPDTFDA